jgi:phage terminase small subunit
MGRESTADGRDGLTGKQRRFVEEYLVDPNATKAAKKAGYAAGQSAEVQGSRLLRSAKVSAAIREGQGARAVRTGITADRTIEEIGRVAYANMRNYLRPIDGGAMVADFTNVTEEQWAAVSEFVVDEYAEGRGADAREVKRTRIKLHAKQPALDSLAKRFGITERRVNIQLPKMADAQDCAEASAYVLDRMGSGEITIEQAQALSNLIEQRRRTIETADLALEVEELKARLGASP